MNKSIITMLLLLCVATIVYGQPFKIEKTVVCDKTEEVFRVLGESFQEVPFWSGNNSGNKTSYALMLNEETKSWTLVQFDTSVACILGIGNDHVYTAK